MSIFSRKQIISSNKNFLYPWKNVTKACNEARNESRLAFEGINIYGILKECPSNDTSYEIRTKGHFDFLGGHYA